MDKKNTLYLAREEVSKLCIAPQETQRTLRFYDNENHQIGEFSWENGEFKFEGNATESAIAFIRLLKELWGVSP